MSTPNLLTPDAHDEVGLTDWIEASMLSEQRAHMPRARIRKHVASTLAADEPEMMVETILKEVARRKRCCPTTYPFSEDGSGIRYEVGVAAVPYVFMLAISTSQPYRDERRHAETDGLFDHLVLDALKRYAGMGSIGHRFGAPASGNRPSNFRDAVTWMAREMRLPSGRGNARPTAGDGGLDVVVWRPFRDARSGFSVLLAQCTVQVDWFGKARDLAQDVWRGWIDFGKDPHLVLAIPFVIPMGYPKWDELRRTVHTVLDRLRLCELLEACVLTEQVDTAKWVASEIARMEN